MFGSPDCREGTVTKEMCGKSYKTRSAMLAILTTGGKSGTITIPQGAVITVVRGPLEDSFLVEAKWENRAVKMFVTDLTERSIMVSRQ
jgi:hypothetical protein